MKTTKAYSKDLADRYDYRHFGGRSGQRVLKRDTGALVALLGAPEGLLLDIPTGTGVYVRALGEHGYSAIAADASRSMLEITKQQTPAPRVLCDINHLPFKSDTFGAATTLRLLSHFPKAQIPLMLRELRRAVKPQGRAIVDSFRWTPRRWPVVRHLVEQSFIYEISDRDMEAMIGEAGLRVVETRTLYLFSPIWLRKLPLPLMRGLELLERLIPGRWHLRVFWALTPGSKSP